jgi:hypothetical protein
MANGKGESEFREPALKQEGGDVEGGAVLDVRFGSVVDGVHDWQRRAGRAVDLWINGLLDCWIGSVVVHNF